MQFGFSVPDNHAKLAFLAGDLPWLADLSEICAVVTMTQITPVPWAQPWFMGLISLLGQIYACTDLAYFMGEERGGEQHDGELIILSPRFRINAALFVERVVGLRDISALTFLPPHKGDAEWIRARWRSADGQEWREISITQLVSSPRFLQAGAPAMAAIQPTQS